MNGEQAAPPAPGLTHTGRKLAPCGLPSSRSWDKAHRSAGVIKAQIPHRVLSHWEACYHIQLGKNLKPRVGLGARVLPVLDTSSGPGGSCCSRAQRQTGGPFWS